MKEWHWELVDEADRLLAASPKVSEAECENAINRVTSACKDVPIVYVEPKQTL